MNTLRRLAIYTLILQTFLLHINSQSLYHRKIECYSFGEEYFNECPILDKSPYSVDIIRTLDESEPCELGVSYGVIRLQYIWVDKGCKAEFMVKAYGFGGYTDTDAAETSHDKLHVAQAPPRFQGNQPPTSKLNSSPSSARILGRRRTQWFPSSSSSNHYTIHHRSRLGEYPYGMRAYPYGDEDVTMTSNDIDANEINSEDRKMAADSTEDRNLSAAYRSKSERTYENLGQSTGKFGASVSNRRPTNFKTVLSTRDPKLNLDPLYRMFHRMKQHGEYHDGTFINSSKDSLPHKSQVTESQDTFGKPGDRSPTALGARNGGSRGRSKKRVLPDNFAYELSPTHPGNQNPTKWNGGAINRELVPRVVDAERFIPSTSRDHHDRINWQHRMAHFDGVFDEHPEEKDVEEGGLEEGNHVINGGASVLDDGRELDVSKEIPEVETAQNSEISKVNRTKAAAVVKHPSSIGTSARPVINFLCPRSEANNFSRNGSMTRCGVGSSKLVKGKKIGLLLVKEILKNSRPCVYGKSYGVTGDRSDVWVTKGCKAWFQILY